MKKLKITNGVILIAIAALHTKFALSSEGFGDQFLSFSKQGFFEISTGLSHQSATQLAQSELQALTAFWFFYFGILLIPIGLLVHHLERNNQRLPRMFTISYLLVVLVGCYMIPYSGMTIFMLPHAIYMLLTNAKGDR